jgi:3-oxoacyl-(acyl-carrier-protein) synthase/phospholipid N-methyltransferase
MGELSPVKRALIEIRQLRAELEKARAKPSEPVAIVGMAMRFPGGVATPERFWEALAGGEDLIGLVPPERWDAQEHLHPDPDHAGTMYDAHLGFLADIDAFDAEFFGINAREAASMDPQQRMLLELTWEGLERAGIDPKGLSNTATGVFLGISNCDYMRVTMGDARAIDAYAAVGASPSIAAGRIAYFLGTHGPAFVVDTACSSSLVALHLAVESLRRSEIDLAIVGASSLILSPEFNVGFCRTRMLSRDGHSKTFDAAADGYVRGEGCGVVVLRRLSDARRDGDPVLAVVAGVAVNHDGRSAGITAPNGPAQEAVIRAALEDAKVEPQAVSYVETHGTGTPLGDPMEVQALAAVYGAGRDASEPLRIGSVKTNLGHTEAAAGLAGLMKVVLMMQPGHGIVPHLHLKDPNPKIAWGELPLEVPTALMPWGGSEPRFAGLSSFGFSGTNAHVILASRGGGEPGVEKQDTASVEEQECLLVLSAAHPESLRALAKRFADFLRETRERFADVCFTAMTGRATLEHRLAVRARDARAAAMLLEKWLADEASLAMAASESAGGEITAGDQLGLAKARFMRGEKLRWPDASASTPPRRVALPVYPFRRTRCWAGPAPEEKRRQERERMWLAAAEAAERQSRQGPLGWSIDDYPARWEAMHRLTLGHARNVLAEAGAFRSAPAGTVDEVMARCAFLPLYRNLVTRWLDGLAAIGELEKNGEAYRTTTGFAARPLDGEWRQTERHLAENAGILAYLRQCSALLGAVLTGKTSALETLFPEGSFALAQGVYETTQEARYLNPIVAAAVREAVRSIGPRRNARVLEVGGGTGSATSAIVSVLPADQVEYWFTDVSDLFLRRAQQRFAAYPFMQYAFFDLDRDLGEQGLGTGRFDVIVGANAVHAARNLKAALGRLQDLLLPGGLMVLLETTQHHSWFDMTTGMIEGWQHFEDDVRGAHPLLSAARWREVLEQNGFSPVVTLPLDGQAVSEIGQHVVLARNGKESVRAVSVVAGTVWKAKEPAAAAWETDFAVRVRSLSGSERDEAMAEFVRATIGRVFNLPADQCAMTARDRLSDLGMDSLIALELRAEMAKGLGLGSRISSTIAFDTGTVGELTRALLELLEEDGKEAGAVPAEYVDAPEAAGNLHPPGAWAANGAAEAMSALLTVDELSALSDDEVEKLLNERLTRR